MSLCWVKDEKSWKRTQFQDWNTYLGWKKKFILIHFPKKTWPSQIIFQYIGADWLLLQLKRNDAVIKRYKSIFSWQYRVLKDSKCKISLLQSFISHENEHSRFFFKLYSVESIQVIGQKIWVWDKIWNLFYAKFWRRSSFVLLSIKGSWNHDKIKNIKGERQINLGVKAQKLSKNVLASNWVDEEYPSGFRSCL